MSRRCLPSRFPALCVSTSPVQEPQRVTGGVVRSGRGRGRAAAHARRHRVLGGPGPGARGGRLALAFGYAIKILPRYDGAVVEVPVLERGEERVGFRNRRSARPRDASTAVTANPSV